MAKGKLYITITDDRGGGNGTPTPKPESPKEKEEESILGKYIEHQMFHLVKSQVTKMVNFSLNNIGNLTGDYITQRKVNAVKQEISNLMSIGTATIAGAKFGWAGAVVGFAAGITSVISSQVMDNYQNQIEVEKANYSIEQLREKAGLNTQRDGSRGTEN